MNTGGLYWIPLVLLLASIFCGYRLYKSYQSGGQRLIDSPGSPDDGKWVDTGTKVLSKGLVFFTSAFLILAVVIFFMIKSDYRAARPSDKTKWEKQKAKGYA